MRHDLPTFPQSIIDLLAGAGDRPVFEHGDRVVGAASLAACVRRIAAGMRTAGIGPGEGVAMMLGVHPEAFAAIVAAHVVGARVAGGPPGLTAYQLAHLLGEDVAFAVIDDSAAGRSVAALDLPRVRVLDVAELAAAPDDGGPLVAAGRPGDIARVTYTSGSTGTPKGCAQTYAAMAAAWAPYPDRWPSAVRDLASRLDRFLVFGSFNSLVMMEYGVLTLAAGGTMVVADPPSFPDAFARHRATASVITVPRLYRLVRDQRDRPVDLTSLRALMVSGSPLDPGRLREALRVLGPVVFHGYGQTEAGLIAMLTPAEMLASPDSLASVGRPPEAVDVEIRDTDGHPLPAGAVGEVYARTPSQAVGYWSDPVESAEVFVDGWVRTRDLARLAEDGRLHLLGRVRDIIIVDANIVHAGPVERILAGHPDVDEAYVVGALDERSGEAVHAFVVPADPRHAPDERLLRGLVAERLGDAAVPRTITSIAQVPITAAGKPDKRALARQAAAAGVPEPA